MDKVNKEKALEMLEILPPTTWHKTENGEIFQVGEAYDAKNGRFTFATYERIGDDWYYRGHEPKHRKKDNLMENETYLEA